MTVRESVISTDRLTNKSFKFCTKSGVPRLVLTILPALLVPLEPLLCKSSITRIFKITISTVNSISLLPKSSSLLCSRYVVNVATVISTGKLCSTTFPRTTTGSTSIAVFNIKVTPTTPELQVPFSVSLGSFLKVVSNDIITLGVDAFNFKTTILTKKSGMCNPTVRAAVLLTKTLVSYIKTVKLTNIVTIVNYTSRPFRDLQTDKKIQKKSNFTQT